MSFASLTSSNCIGKAVAALAMMAASALPGVAQTVSGTILGTVLDSSGGRVANARVSATNEDTKVRTETVSNGVGNYAMPFLPVGNYTVRIQATGFQTYSRGDLVLRVDQQMRVDATMVVGQVEQQVMVSGASPLLNTENASTGLVVENESISNLPLNGRNFIEMARLNADVNSGASGTLNNKERLTPAQKGLSLSTVGQRDDNIGFFVDGANVRGPYLGSSTLVPSLDSIQEFQVLTSDFTAQFGGGPVHLHVATKSGTNSPHGSLYEFHREAFLNARNAMASSNDLPYHQHNFGGTFGGPIVIPKLYDGRNKTFFFFSYEGRRVAIKSYKAVTVPSADFRKGNLSALLPGTVIKDPLTGIQFPNNTIPDYRIAPQTKAVIPFWPEPSGPALKNNFNGYDPTRTTSDDYLGRLDQTFGGRDQAYGRIALTQPNVLTSVPGVGGDPNFQSINSQYGLNFLASEIHRFSPRIFSESRFAYNRSTYLVGPKRSEDLASVLNWGGVTRTIGLPIVVVSGFGTLADMPAGGYKQQTYQYSENLSIYRGQHAINAGFDILRLIADPSLQSGFQLPAVRATATFAGTYSGNAWADFLLGIPYSGSQSSSQAGYLSPAMTLDYPDVNLYVQDNWKVSRRLVVNLGLRYEWVPVLSSKDLRNFDFSTGQLTPIGVETNFYNGANRNFGPRIGFAWQPFSPGKTVIRAGYGWYYSRSINAGPAQLSLNPPAATSQSFTNLPLTSPGPPAVTMATFLSGISAAVSTGGSLRAIDKDYTPTPSTQIYSFDIQQQLPFALVLDLGYKGSLSTHLDGTVDQNTALPGPGPVNPRRPYPTYASISTSYSAFTANYQAGILRVERRLASGLMLMGSYSFSKTLDQTYGGGFAGDPGDSGGVLSPQDRTNWRAEKGRSGGDIRHRGVVSFVYQLPFGNGKPLLSSGRLLDAFVGGWTFTGIGTFQSGGPMSVQALTDVSNTGTAFQRTDALFNPNLPASQRSPARWFDTSAFVNPTTYRYGNAGRTLVDLPGVNNWDLSLMKDFTATERLRFQFRAEAFNALNHTMLGTPDQTWGDANSTFGVIRSARSPRLIQLALRMLF